LARWIRVAVALGIGRAAAHPFAVAASAPSPESFYASAKAEPFAAGDATLAVRCSGSGAAVVFVHGFPVHGATWRWLLPHLAERFRCVVVDLPGLGESAWSAATDFTWPGHARRIVELAARLELGAFALVAHDTGATVSRHVTLQAGGRVTRLALFNTEIPSHRPPWIPLYQRLARLPGAGAAFRLLLRSRRFVRSGMGFREFYTDRRLLDEPGRLAPYLEPLLASPARMEGMLRYLAGLRWDAVDALARRHAEIQAPVLFLWGEDDRTFPVERAEPMARQLGGPVRFVRIPRASLMPHEERPDAVLEHLLPFLAGAPAGAGALAAPTARG
jgi:pimeloyl-ACP methyl ester carboxylesterase